MVEDVERRERIVAQFVEAIRLREKADAMLAQAAEDARAFGAPAGVIATEVGKAGVDPRVLPDIISAITGTDTGKN
jgi:hypothetical protein